MLSSDELAREVVRPGTPGLKAVVSAFGREVLNEDGSLDRAALSALVFSDDEARPPARRHPPSPYLGPPWIAG